MIKTALSLFLFSIFAFLNELEASSKEKFPVLYQGRFRPAEAYARLWLYEISHTQHLQTPFSSSPLSFLWSLHLKGSSSYQHLPIFWIGSADTKRSLNLPLHRTRFSYQELMQAFTLHPEMDKTLSSLSQILKNFGRLQGASLPLEQAFENRYRILKNENLPPAQIKEILEQEFPLSFRLKEAGALFKCLPGRYQAGEWFSLHALKVHVYSSSSHSLEPIGNFTLFSNAQFESIRKAYLALEQGQSASQEEELSLALQRAYAESLAGQVYQQAHGKRLFYPSLNQLNVESLYVYYPWMKGVIALYFLAACLWPIAPSFGIGVLSLSFLSHTLLLAARSFILERPPVANMFETLLYVPWVAVCLSLFFPSFRRQPLALISACFVSIFLLLIIEAADLNQNFNQVQAVLDSQFWLMVHVLLVVGSYGIFILGAVLGHLYLGSFLIFKKEPPFMNQLPPLILQTLYGGTALLLSGTLLGGVWAAQSWGRFWDWDPKESWAFISLCLYLLCIHAYRFHRIASFGLAFGATAGALAISFTWYGVNYLLGTGLHSYGFGEGGADFYYLFLGIEGLFLASALLKYLHLRRFTFNFSSAKIFTKY